jgi:hypothetical protein
LRDEGDGWASYAWNGRPLSASDLDAPLLARIARYCARRHALFPADDLTDLDAVVAKNAAAVLGIAPQRVPRRRGGRSAIVDARLQPHEWVRTDAGAILKTDAIAHGDDHFFPGPTDVAWDVAGAIVEWDLDDAAQRSFLEMYRDASDDRDVVEERISPWIFAYAVCRAAFTAFARDGAPASERARLDALFHRYCRAAEAI